MLNECGLFPCYFLAGRPFYDTREIFDRHNFARDVKRNVKETDWVFLKPRYLLSEHGILQFAFRKNVPRVIEKVIHALDQPLLPGEQVGEIPLPTRFSFEAPPAQQQQQALMFVAMAHQQQQQQQQLQMQQHMMQQQQVPSASCSSSNSMHLQQQAPQQHRESITLDDWQDEEGDGESDGSGEDSAPHKGGPSSCWPPLETGWEGILAVDTDTPPSPSMGASCFLPLDDACCTTGGLKRSRGDTSFSATSSLSSYIEPPMKKMRSSAVDDRIHPMLFQ
jgi:hypothetical protein